MIVNISQWILIFVLLLINRIWYKEMKLHYSNYYTTRMENIDLQNELTEQKKLNETLQSKYNNLKGLAITQTDILNRNNGVVK